MLLVFDVAALRLEELSVRVDADLRVLGLYQESHAEYSSFWSAGRFLKFLSPAGISQSTIGISHLALSGLLARSCPKA